MKRNMTSHLGKNFSLLLLSSIIGISACSSPNTDLQKAIDDIRNTSITIPNTDRGAVSGSIQFDTSSGTIPETTVKVIRDADITEKDANGKTVIDPKTKKEKIVEKKGQIIGTATVGSNGSFLVTNLRAGAVIVNISNKTSSNEVSTTIESGKVNELKNINFGALKSGKSSTLNITGQVVKSDGTPVANAKVADVSVDSSGTFSLTNAEGEFTLPVNPFTNSKNIEVSSGDLITSLAVSPDQVENLVIPLIANSRTIKGIVFDSVNRIKPVANVQVKVIGTNTSAVSDDKGNFTLRGVPLSASTLELGNVDGYINTRVNVDATPTSGESSIQPVFIRPIGNLFVNIQPDYTRPYIGSGPFQAATGLVDPVTVKDATGKVSFYYSNKLVFPQLTGTIQIEGTQIVKEFTIPATPTLNPAPKDFVSATESTQVTVYEPNFKVSVPINNIPGGEYTLSISLPFHQTQKGIKVVIPSNDTIATELIQMNVVQAVVTVGDISGKIVIKDRNGNVLQLPAGLQIRVKALSSDIDISGSVTTGSGDSAVTTSRAQAELSSDYSIVGTDGKYTLFNIKTGTAILLAGVFSVAADGTATELNNSYLPATYTLLNVVGGAINNAPDITIVQR
jgi:hypothetical protein